MCTLSLIKDVKRTEIESNVRNYGRKWTAVHYEVSLSTLDRFIKKCGLTRVGWGRKLNIDKASQIRGLYSTGNYTQAEIAELFKVRREIINKIVNNRLYSESDMGLGGSANVKLIFNYSSI